MGIGCLLEMFLGGMYHPFNMCISVFMLVHDKLKSCIYFQSLEAKAMCASKKIRASRWFRLFADYDGRKLHFSGYQLVEQVLFIIRLSAMKTKML